jgi:hypothetical protein
VLRRWENEINKIVHEQLGCLKVGCTLLYIMSGLTEKWVKSKIGENDYSHRSIFVERTKEIELRR